MFFNRSYWATENVDFTKQESVPIIFSSIFFLVDIYSYYVRVLPALLLTIFQNSFRKFEILSRRY
jgi:hypothetical protein